MILYLSNCSEIYQVYKKQSCWKACQISEQYNYFNLLISRFQDFQDVEVNQEPGWSLSWLH